ncbi:iduronate-2-sulfatase [Oceaniferula spumae]|uniref:Iduronate-2-sulfatase n=1 Tax=Oceaniferula spumae TaxID=2979115 RepID=A0AAT9FRQ5_9BACT
MISKLILGIVPLLVATHLYGEEVANRPNVLFIAVDDLRPELGCFGAEVKTPNFDKLAASGAIFSKAYCQQAVCGASRVSLMTGLYPTKTGEHTFHVKDWRKRHPKVVTLQQNFQAQGYHCVGMGKIYHGNSGPDIDPAHWDDWEKVAGKSYALPESLTAQANNTARKGKQPKGPSTESAEVDDNFYREGQLADVAARKLAELSKAKKPFFLAVGFQKPHLPFVAPKKYWDLYQREDFVMPSNRGVPPGYPPYATNRGAGELVAYADIGQVSPKDFPKALNQRLLHGYAACVSYTDRNLGVVLKALEKNGLAENTIVVLWGDHGWKLGDHSSWCKHTNFECDTRVPLFVRAPGKKGSLEVKQPVELIDLYPTLCELSGLQAPAHLQGKSFAKLLAQPETHHRDTAYSVYPHGKFMGHSIRSGNYRYTEWHDRKSGEVTARVLTDLVEDPGETTNVVNDPAHARSLQLVQKQLTDRIASALK